MGASFIGLHPFQWIAIISAALTLLLLADALDGRHTKMPIHAN